MKIYEKKIVFSMDWTMGVVSKNKDGNILVLKEDVEMSSCSVVLGCAAQDNRSQS